MITENGTEREGPDLLPDTELDEDFLEESREILVGEEDAGLRTDVFIAREFSELSRNYVQNLISEGYIKVNDSDIKANYKLKQQDRVLVQIPVIEELSIEAEDIALDILFEDSDVIVINKPQGMVVHPAPGNYSGTLVNALMGHCKDLSGINGIMRPGIVHRLDKDTSGVIMVAKNDQAHVSLAQQIKDRTVTRRYLALVHGIVTEPAGVVDAPIGRDSGDRKKMAVTTKSSRHAVTHYRVLERFENYTLIDCKLETGRTHQIRVHMKYIKHPIVGDPVYGPVKSHFNLKGQLLHAVVLGFKHPGTGIYHEFEAPLPDYFDRVLSLLRNN